MSYTFVADIFDKKKLGSRLSSSEVRFYAENGRFACLRPPLAAKRQRTMIIFIEKRVVDYLLVLIELFSLRVTAEALRANICSKWAISLQRRPDDLKFHLEGVASTNHSYSQKTRLNDLLHGIKICTHLFVCRQKMFTSQGDSLSAKSFDCDHIFHYSRITSITLLTF